MSTTATGRRLPVPALDRLDQVTAALAATAGEYDRSGAFPHAAIQVVHDAGLLTAGVDPRFGGTGVNSTELATILLALGKGDPSVALITAMTLLPHAFQQRQPWPEELYARVLAESAERPTLLNNARVEPDLGSPARGGLPATLARRTGSGWSVSGRKRFVTGAEGLSYFLVWAATDEETPRVGTFVVPGRSPGIEILPTWQQLGLRASGSHDVAFTEVEIPEENVLGITEYGAKAEQDNLAGGGVHVLVSALYLGVARAAQEYVHTFAHERVPSNLGRPLATTDRFKQTAGEIETLLSTAEQLVFGVADRLDRGLAVPGTEALAAKVVAVRHVTTAVQTGLRLLGNPGLAQANPLERHFRDIQSAGVHAPQEDTSLLTIGAAVLAAAAPGA